MTRDSNFGPRNRVYRPPGDNQVISRIWHPIGRNKFLFSLENLRKSFLFPPFRYFMCLLFYDCSSGACFSFFSPLPSAEIHVCRQDGFIANEISETSCAHVCIEEVQTWAILFTPCCLWRWSSCSLLWLF